MLYIFIYKMSSSPYLKWTTLKASDKILSVCSDSAQNIFQNCMRYSPKLYETDECLIKQLNEMNFCVPVLIKKYEKVPSYTIQ